MSDDGAFVIYSASENQTALDYTSDDDKDPNSVFTRYFVKELETPGPVAGAGRQAHAGQRHRPRDASSSMRRSRPITTRSWATWC